MKPKTLFYSSLIAAAAMSTVPAFAADAEKIQISYGSGATETSSNNDDGEGTISYSDGWNKATKKSNSSDAASTVLRNSADAETTATTTWTSNNTWQRNATDEVLQGYLDDGGSGITITVSNISYLVYDVTVIASTDSTDKKYTAKTINGQTYTSDGSGNGILGSTTWGDTNTTTVVAGENSFTVSGLTGNLSLSSTGSNTSSARGCVAGLIITDGAAGVSAVTKTLDGTDSTWTTTSLAGTTWANSTETTPTYANLTMSAATTLTLESGVITDAIWAHGSGVLTLAGEELKFIGLGILRADTGTSIAVNNTLNFTDGGTLSGTITTGDSGSIVVKSGTLNAFALTGSGLNFSVESGATVNFGFVAGISQNLTGEGTVSLSSTAHSKTIDLGTAFTGTVNISGDVQLNSHKFGSDTATVNVTGTTHFWSATAGTQEITQALTFKENTATRVGGWDSKTTTLTLSGGMTFEDGATFTVDTCTNGTAIRVDITGAITNGNITQKVGTLNISGSGTNTISTLTQSGGTLNISAGTTTITDITQTGGTFKQSGGTLNISGEASFSTFNISGSSSKLNFSGTGTKTIGSFSTPGDDGTDRTISIDAGTTVESTSFSNTWGIKTLTVNGELNVSGEMLYSSGSMTNTINGSGTLTAGTFTAKNVGTYVFSDGLTTNITTLNVSRPTTFSNTGKNTIGTVSLSAQTLTFSGTGTTEITDITQTGGTLNFTGTGTTKITNITQTGGALNFSINTLNNSSFSEGAKIVVNTGTVTFGANAQTISTDSFGKNLTVEVASGAQATFAIAQHTTKGYAGNLTLKNGATYLKHDGGIDFSGSVTLGESDSDTVYLLGNWGKDGTKISGVLSGAGTAYFGADSNNALEKLTISGSDNSYSGEIIVGKKNATTNSSKSTALVLTATTALEHGNVNLAGVSESNYSELTLGNTAITIAGLSGTQYGRIALASDTSASTLTVVSATDKEFAGTIGNGVSLVKQGTGTLKLSGDNSANASDVTVDAGVLEVANTSALGTGKVSVAKDAKLGLVAGTTVKNVTGGVELAEGAKLVIDMTGQTASAAVDDKLALTLVVGSALSYNGDTFESNCTTLITEGVVEFENLDSSLTSWVKSLSYASDTSTLTLTMTIPEPSTFGLLAGVGALALVAARRRRRAK